MSTVLPRAVLTVSTAHYESREAVEAGIPTYYRIRFTYITGVAKETLRGTVYANTPDGSLNEKHTMRLIFDHAPQREYIYFADEVIEGSEMLASVFDTDEMNVLRVITKKVLSYVLDNFKK